jgi:hypothetical protein
MIDRVGRRAKTAAIEARPDEKRSVFPPSRALIALSRAVQVSLPDLP